MLYLLAWSRSKGASAGAEQGGRRRKPAIPARLGLFGDSSSFGSLGSTFPEL